MSVRRRLQDALSSPTRFFWFVVRAVHLAVTGRIMRSVARLFPHTTSNPNYQRWIVDAEAKQGLSLVFDPSSLVSHPVAFLIATTAASLPKNILWSGNDVRVAPNCWLTGVMDGGWRTPVRWEEELASKSYVGRIGPLPLGDVLADVEREAGLPLWVIFIDEETVLDPQYLAIIATTARRRAGTRLIYTDHDRLNNKRRHDPVFKPAWDPIQMQERNYVGSCCAIGADLLRKCWPQLPAARFNLDTLLLECAQILEPGEALHIPRILWHRLDAIDAGRTPTSRLTTEQFIRQQSPPKDEDPPLVSVIIPARDHVDLTRRCIDSLVARTKGGAYEILLVDNGSIESSTWEYYQRELLAQAVRLVFYPGAFNFSELCNAGAASSRGRVLVFLNNDTEIISPDWLTELCSLATRQEYGAVGPLLLHGDGTIQHAGILMGLNGTADRPLVNVRPEHAKARDWCSTRRTVGAVLGACLAIERDKYCAIGGMDPRYAVSHNEVDLCLRLAQMGQLSVFTPHVRLIHLESGTRGYDLTPSQRAKLNEETHCFSMQWGSESKVCDPAYHPNFKRNGSPFALALVAPPCEPRTGWDAAVLQLDEPKQVANGSSAYEAAPATHAPSQ